MHQAAHKNQLIFIYCVFFRSVAKIHLGQLEYFELGNLDSMRDWGHAKVRLKTSKVKIKLYDLTKYYSP